MTKVTKEMINAAHDVTMKSKLMLGHELLEKIYLAMDSQRTWVGLTDEERKELRSRVQEYTPIDSVQYGLAVQYATEEKLKEMNK